MVSGLAGGQNSTASRRWQTVRGNLPVAALGTHCRAAPQSGTATGVGRFGRPARADARQR